jgi:hypothetical protein
VEEGRGREGSVNIDRVFTLLAFLRNTYAQTKTNLYNELCNTANLSVVNDIPVYDILLCSSEALLYQHFVRFLITMVLYKMNEEYKAFNTVVGIGSLPPPPQPPKVHKQREKKDSESGMGSWEAAIIAVCAVLELLNTPLGLGTE